MTYATIFLNMIAKNVLDFEKGCGVCLSVTRSKTTNTHIHHRVSDTERNFFGLRLNVAYVC